MAAESWAGYAEGRHSGRPVASDGVTAGNGAAGVQVKCARRVEGHSPELLQEPGDPGSPRLRVG